MSIEHLATAQLRSEIPNLQTKGFATALLDAVIGRAHPGMSSEERNGFKLERADLRPPFRPDAFTINSETQVITCYEVEDTHPLSENKLRLLARWWDYLHCEGWAFRVVVTDRYGKNQRELPMMDYFYRLVIGHEMA